MKKNFKKVSAVLMIAAATTFSMTSCGGGMTEAEAEAAAEEILKDLDASVEDVTEDIVEVSDGLSSNLFTSEDGNFQINFLGTPVESSESVPTEVGNIEMTTYMYEKSATEVYMVAYNDYPSGILEYSSPEDLLLGGKDGVVESMGITSFDFEEEVSKDGHAGLHFRGTNGTYYVEYEMYLVENRLYQVGILRDGSYPTQERVDDFLGTFAFTE